MKIIKFNKDQIKHLARKKDIQIKELSKSVGVSRQHFDHLIKGGTFSVEKLAIICEVLDCTPNDFFDISAHYEVNNIAAEPTTIYDNIKTLPEK